MLADVACDGNLVCYATGKQGVTLLTTTGGTSWTQQAGGGTTQQMNGISCTSDEHLLRGRQRRHDPQDDERRPDLVAADERHDDRTSTASRASRRTACVAVGAVASGAAVVRFTTDGTTWNAGTEHRHAGAERRRVPVRRRVSRRRRGRHGHRPADGGATWTPDAERHDERAERGDLPVADACYAVGAGGTILQVPERSTAARGAADEQHDQRAQRRRVRQRRLTASPTARSAPTIATGDGGTTWAQQGNPISGPTTALNATEHRAERRGLHLGAAASSAPARRATS